MEITPQLWLLIVGGGLLAFLVFIGTILSRSLKKAAPGTALVKTGFGMKQAKIYLSSCIVFPLLHRVEIIDLTVKVVSIIRREGDSLSCADGIRAEVEVDFYIQINSVELDIRRVAQEIGCARASDTRVLRELFEGKFSDALKTAGNKLPFDDLYQNRVGFRDEILKALGQEGEGDIVLNGYRLNDVSIRYLEQLPLPQHDENNVLDAVGRKVIAERTASEAEATNKRLRQKEVEIANQNRNAELEQLAITQELEERRAAQARAIAEAAAREDASTRIAQSEQVKVSEEKEIADQQTIALAKELQEQAVEKAKIAREKAVALDEERKQQEVAQQRIEREKAVALDEEQKTQAVLVAQEEKTKAGALAKIEREGAEASALKEKLALLEETAKQDALRLEAEEKALTAKEMEIANRQKQIEVIEAEKEAAVEKEMKNVEADVRSYEIKTVAQARLEAAELDAAAAAKQALAIEEVGRAEAEANRLKLEAENVINERVILANALNDLMPQLPDLVERLMLPAEKIDSIKILNINGMEGVGGLMPGASTNGQNPSVGGSLINTVLSIGMFLPVLKEIMKALQGSDQYDEFFATLKKLPGGDALIHSLENQGPAVGDGGPNAPKA